MKTTYYKLGSTWNFPLRKISGNMMSVWRNVGWEDYYYECITECLSFYEKCEITEAEAFRYILEN